MNLEKLAIKELYQAYRKYKGQIMTEDKFKKMQKRNNYILVITVGIFIALTVIIYYFYGLFSI